MFNTYWPQFETEFKRILDSVPQETVVAPREEKDILGEILETTRNMSKRISALEGKNSGGGARSILSSSSYTDHILPKNLRWEKTFCYDNQKVDWRNLLQVLMYGGKTVEEVRSLLTDANISKEQIDEIIMQVITNSPTDKSSEG